MPLQLSNQTVDEGNLLLVQIYPANKWKKEQQNSPFFEASTELMDVGMNHQWLLIPQKDTTIYVSMEEHIITHETVLPKQNMQASFRSTTNLQEIKGLKNMLPTHGM